MNDQIQRIFEIIADKKMNQAQFSKAIGIGPASLSHLKKGRNKSASSDVLKKIIERFDDINPDWLLTGKGTMKISPENRVAGMIDGRLSDSGENKQQKYNEPKKLTTSVKTPDLFNTNSFERQPARPITTGQAVKQPDGSSHIIEKEVIIYKEKPPKTIEKLVIFFSDSTYETFIPEKQ